ncbi:hypothetical protein PPTG_24778 [Phytophthora nicotianae INRA-310]|uniref:Uncharacterized protein n=1 Tax=Phytophthora nicotianae (strain INRA-310) TaxID=761204 RepID=W2PBB7_PHYN3|nr:hypothetical protein PPTG_24778 [Phytophthora nicotianae INRA-310]ETM97960.1 hypothetical protein PPTG_24778 [Phytophthora nicotianae INRA-310]
MPVAEDNSADCEDTSMTSFIMFGYMSTTDPSELPTLGNTLCSTRESISALSAPPILSQMAQMRI